MPHPFRQFHASQGIDWRTKGVISDVIAKDPCDSVDIIVSVNLAEATHFIEHGVKVAFSM